MNNRTIIKYKEKNKCKFYSFQTRRGDGPKKQKRFSVNSWSFCCYDIGNFIERTISGPYKDRKKIMKTLCNKAEVPYFRFHALRHFGASSLDQKNMPLASIQKLLGHESRITTEIYLHSINESEKAAMDMLNDEFSESLTQKQKRLSTKSWKPLVLVVRLAGFEPATYGLEDR